MEEYAQNKDAEWEKAESYFIALGQKPKFHQRVKVWLFKLNFDKNMKDLTLQQNTILEAFQVIIESPKLRKLFGAVLRFGNLMNAGNKSRGQADGFDLNDLKSTGTLKDPDGRSILQIICKTLYEEDNEFIKFKSDFKAVYDSVKLSTEDLQKKTDSLRTENNKANGLFNMIDKADDKLMEKKFGKEMKKFLDTTEEKIEEAEKKQKMVMDKFKETCDLLMVKKAEEIRAKSDKFMEFFVAFFNDVQKAMPKVEEKKEKKGGSARKAMQANLMAEL